MSQSNQQVLKQLAPEKYLERVHAREILQRIVLSLLDVRPEFPEQHIVKLLSPMVEMRAPTPTQEEHPKPARETFPSRTIPNRQEPPRDTPSSETPPAREAFPSKPQTREGFPPRPTQSPSREPFPSKAPQPKDAFPPRKPAPQPAPQSHAERFPSYKPTKENDLGVYPSQSIASANKSIAQRRYSAISPDVLRKAGNGVLRRKAMSSKMTSSTTVEIRLIPKDESTFKSLEETVKKVELFSFLSDDQRKTLISAMFPLTFDPNHVIIRQGDQPDNFYIVTSGSCAVTITKDGVTNQVATVGPGQYFGDLALISGSTRAATVTTLEKTDTWAIDQTTYLGLLKEGHSKKRNLYRTILRSVEVLKSLDDYQILLIADALHPYDPKEGELVVKEGEIGDNFFMIIEGSCVVRKKNPRGEEVEVAHLSAGNYFGEMALINNAPRAATVIAQEGTKLVELNRESFNRLLGSCKSYFTQKMRDYKSTS